MATTDTLHVADSGAGGHGAFIPEFWLGSSLGSLHKARVLPRLVNRSVEQVVSSYGDTVNVPIRGSLVANQKVAQTSVTLQSPVGTKTQIVLDNHYEVSFLIEDILASESIQKQYLGYVAEAGIAMANEVTESISSLYVDAGVTYGSETDTVDETYFKNLRKWWNLNEVSDANRTVVIHDWTDMLSIPRFTEAATIGPNTSIREGTMGRIYGIDIFEEIKMQTTTASPSAGHGMAFTPDFVYLTTRPLSSPESVGQSGAGVQMAYLELDGVGMRLIQGYNMTYTGNQVTMDLLWGADTVRPTLGLAEVRYAA